MPQTIRLLPENKTRDEGLDAKAAPGVIVKKSSELLEADLPSLYTLEDLPGRTPNHAIGITEEY